MRCESWRVPTYERWTLKVMSVVANGPMWGGRANEERTMRGDRANNSQESKKKVALSPEVVRKEPVVRVQTQVKSEGTLMLAQDFDRPPLTGRMMMEDLQYSKE